MAIIGCGVVGRATGKAFARRGFEVYFRDIDPGIVADMRAEGCDAGLADAPYPSQPALFFVCVPTPTEDSGTDLSYIESALTAVGQAIRNANSFVLIVIRSTVPVGTAGTMAVPLIERISGRRAGVDFAVCSNPEYLRAVSTDADSEHPRLIVIGCDDDRSAHILEDAYRNFGARIERLSTREAEMHKYIHNLFNACKISYFNEQRIICEMLGLDASRIFPLVAETAEASWNPQYGIQDRGPFAGSCLPKDAAGFLGWVQQQGASAPLLAAAIKVNEAVRHKNGE